jgi:hypothetical protein
VRSNIDGFLSIGSIVSITQFKPRSTSLKSREAKALARFQAV